MKDFLKDLESFEPIIKAECRKKEILGMSWEDQAQEVRIKLWRKYPSFKGNSSFKTWANRVMINCIKDLERTSKMNKRKPLNEAISSDDLE